MDPDGPEARPRPNGEFVFVYRHNAGKGKGGPGHKNHAPRPPRRVGTMNNSGWQQARLQASAKYPEVFGREAPEGIRAPHVHDLRHTLGRRLRAAGVPLETRQAPLGHKNGNSTTHYSAAELLELYRAAEKVESGASAPLLRNVQKTCSPEKETGRRISVSR